MSNHKRGKKSNKKLVIHKGILSRQRVKMKEHGFFDGRFVARAVANKKKYSRKGKKQKQDYEND
jgi:hypothetical protein